MDGLYQNIKMVKETKKSENVIYVDKNYIFAFPLYLWKMLYDMYWYSYFISSQGLWKVAGGFKENSSVAYHKSFCKNKNKILK